VGLAKSTFDHSCRSQAARVVLTTIVRPPMKHNPVRISMVYTNHLKVSYQVEFYNCKEKVLFRIWESASNVHVVVRPLSALLLSVSFADWHCKLFLSRVFSDRILSNSMGKGYVTPFIIKMKTLFGCCGSKSRSSQSSAVRRGALSHKDQNVDPYPREKPAKSEEVPKRVVTSNEALSTRSSSHESERSRVHGRLRGKGPSSTRKPLIISNVGHKARDLADIATHKAHPNGMSKISPG
jgi:hypothetical protein